MGNLRSKYTEDDWDFLLNENINNNSSNSKAKKQAIDDIRKEMAEDMSNDVDWEFDSFETIEKKLKKKR